MSVLTPFVRLVDDDHAVLAEEQIRLNLPKQDTVRHELGQQARPDALVVTHLVPDVAAQGNVQLRGDARGGGRRRHAPNLRHGHRAGAPARRGRHCRSPCKNCGTWSKSYRHRLAADDHDGIRVDGVHDIVLRTENRKTLAHLLYVVQAGHGHGRRPLGEHPEFRRAAARPPPSFAAASCAAVLRIDRRRRRRGTERLDSRLGCLFGVALANLRGEFARSGERRV